MCDELVMLFFQLYFTVQLINCKVHFITLILYNYTAALYGVHKLRSYWFQFIMSHNKCS